MCLCDSLQSVDSGSPCLDKTCFSAAAADRPANDQGRALSSGRHAMEVDAAGFCADETKNWSGEGASRRHDKPRIAGAPAAYLLPPLFGRSSYLPMVDG